MFLSTQAGSGSPEEGRETDGEGTPLRGVLRHLERALEEADRAAAARLHEELWEPLRRMADRMGSLRDEALRSEDPLRGAGRAVRLLCSEMEELAPAERLRRELERHAEAVGTLAHEVPRVLTRADGRRVPARATTRCVLGASYMTRLVEEVGLTPLVVELVGILPSTPADLLDPTDRAGALLGEIDRRERTVRETLETLSREEVARLEERLRGGGILLRLRVALERRRAVGRWRRAREVLDAEMAVSRSELRTALRLRRFSADLARRERALAEAAGETADLLERGAGGAVGLRRLAGRLEELVEEAPPPEPAPARLESMGRGLARELEELRANLPGTERPESDFPHALDRLVRLAEALVEVSTTLGQEGDAARGVPGEPGLVATAELRARVARTLAEVRRLLFEAEEIFGHGLQATRAEAVSSTAGGEELEQLVRATAKRTAARLRAAAALLEETLREAAEEVRRLPSRMVGRLRERVRATEVRSGAASRAGRRLRPGLFRLQRSLRRTLVRGREALRPLVERLRGALPLPWTQGDAALRRRLATAGAPDETAREAVSTAWGLSPSASLARLPPLYRWLFRDEPLLDPHLLVGRAEEVDRIRERLERHRDGERALLAVVGEPGSGRTSLVNCALGQAGGALPLRRGRPERRISDGRQALAWFTAFLGPAVPEGTEQGPDGRPALDSVEALAGALGNRREVVVLEEGERLFRRAVGGFQAVEVLKELVGATADRLAWVVTFTLEAWLYLRAVTGLDATFGEVLRMEPLSRKELEETIMARHRLTGYDLRFEPDAGLTRRRRKLLAAASGEERQALLARWRFDDLHREGGRSVGLALQLWRASLRPVSEGVLEVGPVQAPETAFLEELDRGSLLVLAEFVLHGDLRPEELPPLPEEGRRGAVERATRMRELGILEAVPGLPPPAPLRVHRWMHGPVMDHLHDRRLLPL